MCDMAKLNEHDIKFLIEAIKAGKELPLEYKYALFPTKQKEYELIYAGKMRKEDVLADNEESMAVPLQTEKVFNSGKAPSDEDQLNILAFGDNLQLLKTLYKNEDPIIKDKVKGRVKLIYIDPPFGTGDKYDGSKGQSAYSARKKGADFVEFLRRRLILLRELLADDGSIMVRIDYHFGHYVKIVMDEVFGRGNFKNEIVINRFKRQLRNLNQFNVATDTIFFYGKTENSYFNEVEINRLCAFCGSEREAQWGRMHSGGLRNPPERTVLGETLLPPKGRHWSYKQERIDELVKLGRVRINPDIKYTDIQGKKIIGMPEYLQSDTVPVDSNWTDIKGYVFASDYPTENPEELLKRIIEATTEEGDLVMDVFAGSGTTLAVADKMNRRWIGGDIGKLSIYTIQKRLLEIGNSWDLNNNKRKYKDPAQPFAVVSSGLYDLGNLFALKKNDYIDFAKRLFEVEEVKAKDINGISVDGKKRNDYVKIFPYWEFEDVSVDEEYVNNIHQHIGEKIGEKFYIIAPANNVDFISDYLEIDGKRYYFLKIPYQVIKELHKVQFKKLSQPQSKSQINDLDDAVGFHFIQPPKVKSAIRKNNGKLVLEIEQFDPSYIGATENEKRFAGLAMIILDYDFKGDHFVMDEYLFADQLLKKKAKEDDALVDELKKVDHLTIPLPEEKCGDKIMAIYVDIHGNEFKEVLNVS